MYYGNNKDSYTVLDDQIGWPAELYRIDREGSDRVYKCGTTWCYFLRRSNARGRVYRGIRVIACFDAWQRDFFLA